VLALAIVGLLSIAIGFIWPWYYIKFLSCPYLGPSGVMHSCPAEISQEPFLLTAVALGAVCLVGAAMVVKKPRY
jgi:hypothetical protein